MAGKRIARLNEQIRRELTEMIRFEVRDPRIGVVTITDVEVSPDLYHAKVFFAPHGDADEKQKAHEGLKAAAGFLRTELGKRLHIRRAPELQFAFDGTLEHAQHIERLLKEARASMSTTADEEEAAVEGDDASRPDPEHDDS